MPIGGNVTRLSYSTINLLLNAPHAYLNKINGLDTFTTEYFEQGKEVHNIIQKHCSGQETHKLLGKLPTFERVETKDFDENMHVSMEYNGYLIHGYVDMISDQRQEFADIKSGKKWSPAKMAKHPQFWLYHLMTGLNNFVLINAPKDTSEWNDTNITTMTMKFTDKHKDKARSFIDSGIAVLDDLKAHVTNDITNIKQSGFRSRYCFYTDCPVCSSMKG